jgi:hypothetical protein
VWKNDLTDVREENFAETSRKGNLRRRKAVAKFETACTFAGGEQQILRSAQDDNCLFGVK